MNCPPPTWAREVMETTTTTDNAGNGNRIDQFKSEVTDLNLKTGNVGREKLLAVLGVLLMIVGIGGAFLAYVSSLNMDSALDVQSQIVYGVAFLTLVGRRCGAVPALLASPRSCACGCCATSTRARPTPTASSKPSRTRADLMRTVAITGSGSGIGAATAARLTAEGWKVIGVDLRGAEIEADLGNPAGRQAAVAAVTDACGGTLDALITCAGIAGLPGRPTSLLAAINYFGTVEVMEGLRPALAKGDRPSAVAISSNSTTTAPNYSVELVEALLAGDEAEALRVADEVAGESMLEYAATKLAVAYWVRQNAVSEEWGRAGIRLNAIAPGMIATADDRGGPQRRHRGAAARHVRADHRPRSARPPRGDGRPAGVPGRHREHVLLRLDRLLRRWHRRPVPHPGLPARAGSSAEPSRSQHLRGPGPATGASSRPESGRKPRDGRPVEEDDVGGGRAGRRERHRARRPRRGGVTDDRHPSHAPPTHRSRRADPVDRPACWPRPGSRWGCWSWRFPFGRWASIAFLDAFGYDAVEETEPPGLGLLAFLVGVAVVLLPAAVALWSGLRAWHAGRGSAVVVVGRCRPGHRARCCSGCRCTSAVSSAGRWCWRSARPRRRRLVRPIARLGALDPPAVAVTPAGRASLRSRRRSCACRRGRRSGRRPSSPTWPRRGPWRR